MTITADPTVCSERAWRLHDAAVRLDGLLLDLRRAIHVALGTVGPEIDLRLPRELVRALGHLNTAIGEIRALAAELTNETDGHLEDRGGSSMTDFSSDGEATRIKIGAGSLTSALALAKLLVKERECVPILKASGSPQAVAA